MPLTRKETHMEPLYEEMKKHTKKGALYLMPTQGERRYTTADIESLPEGRRAELIAGKMYMMAAPSLNHQVICVWLSTEIANYIRSHQGKCRVLPAPFGIFIKNDEENYLEPDISVICDDSKLDQKGCHGAPDWVIEVASPSSRWTDQHLKLSVYADAGVREYWIVDYDSGNITVYRFEDSPKPILYQFTDIVPIGIYGNDTIDFSPLSDELDRLRP